MAHDPDLVIRGGNIADGLGGEVFEADVAIADGRIVEDIPEPVLSAGIPWAWESFPDYMDWLSKRNFDVDVGAQLPHAALRVYVMGERGARRDPATAEDNTATPALAGEAVRAGALGISTSRTLNHRTSTCDYTPTL